MTASMAVILRIAGIGCILAGSSGLGICFAKNLKNRLELLQTFRRMVYMLKGEIVYANSPLEEAFDHVGRKNEGMIGEMFLKVAQKLKARNGESFAQIWSAEAEKAGNDSQMTSADKKEMIEFGEHLGYLDVNMQERTILLYLEQLDLSIGYLREHQRDKSRLYTSLGIMGGLFLVIVLL